MKQFLKRMFHITETVTHINYSSSGYKITVNGKNVDPESKQGKKLIARMEKKVKIIDGGMDEVSKVLRNMAKAL